MRSATMRCALCVALIGLMVGGTATRAEAGLVYDFNATDSSGGTGTLVTDITNPASGPITINASDVVSVIVDVPGDVPHGATGSPSLLISGSLTSTSDLSSLSSGQIKIVFGSGNADLLLSAGQVQWNDSAPSLSYHFSGDWSLDPASDSVPEPSTLVSAMLAGLMSLGYAWHRHRKAKRVGT